MFLCTSNAVMFMTSLSRLNCIREISYSCSMASDVTFEWTFTLLSLLYLSTRWSYLTQRYNGTR